MARTSADTARIRRRALGASRQRCCICHQMPATLHHINGDPDDNRHANLVALCPEHHRQVLSQDNDLTPDRLYRLKLEWERECIRAVLRDAGCGCTR